MPDETNPTLRGRLPSLFPLYDDSMEFESWLDAHQDELDELDADLAQVKDEIHIGTATGQELDLIGEEYGVLGRRRGRDDSSYRAYLMSLMASFQGVGTVPGVKHAVSSGLLVDEDAVGVIEDFVANKYEIELTDWTAHETSTVRALADLADPLAIGRRDPIHYHLPTTVARSVVKVDWSTNDVANLSAAELWNISEGKDRLSSASQLPTENRIDGVAVIGTASTKSTTVRTNALSSASMGNLSGGPELA
jgi:hypothetical protein